MNKWSILKLLTIGSLHLGINAGFSFIAIIIPLFLVGFTKSKTTIGVVMSLGFLIGMIVFPFASWYSDRIWTPIGKRKPFILLGIVIATLSLVLCGHSLNFIMVIICLVGIWIGINLASGPVRPLLSDVVPVEQKGKAFGFFHFWAAVATLLIGMVGGPLYGVQKFYAFYLAAFLLVVTGITTFTIKEPFLIRNDKDKDLEKTSLKIRIRSYIIGLFQERKSVKIIFLLFLLTISMGLFFPFFPLFLKEILKLPDSRIPMLMVIPALIGLPVSIIYGVLVDKIKIKKLLYFSLTVQTLVVFGFCYVRNVAQVIILAVIGSVVGGTLVILSTLFSKVIPASRRGAFWAFNNIAWNMGWIIGAPLGGIIVDSMGYRVNFLICSVVMLFSILSIKFLEVS
jgi:maltose/moltooligosaccharide transporter